MNRSAHRVWIRTHLVYRTHTIGRPYEEFISCRVDAFQKRLPVPLKWNFTSDPPTLPSDSKTELTYFPPPGGHTNLTNHFIPGNHPIDDSPLRRCVCARVCVSALVCVCDVAFNRTQLQRPATFMSWLISICAGQAGQLFKGTERRRKAGTTIRLETRTQ